MDPKVLGASGGRVSRRRFLKGAAGLAATGPLLSILTQLGCGGQTSPAASQSASPSTSAASSASGSPSKSPSAEDLKRQLVEAATKEGKVAWYTSNPVDQATPIGEAFQAAFPGIKVEVFRAQAEEVRERAVTEFNAGRYVADVLELAAADAYYLAGRSVIRQHTWPEAKAFDPQLKDPNGFFVGTRLVMGVPSYNTKLVSATEAPKSYEDLLDPKWKGKMALEESDQILLMGLSQIWSKDKAIDWARKLAQQDIQMRKGHSQMTGLLSAGEFSIDINSYAYIVEKEKAKGAPVEWIKTNPVFVNPTVVMIAAKAAHPNAAILFADWVNSKAGMDTYAKVGHVPARLDSPPQVASLAPSKMTFKVVYAKSSEEDAEWQKVFRDIFWPKR